MKNPYYLLITIFALSSSIYAQEIVDQTLNTQVDANVPGVVAQKEIDNLDEQCAVNNLVINKSLKVDAVNVILNNSFGMLGINSALVLKKFNESTS